MVEVLLISILPIYLGGLVLSWGIEGLLQPRPVAPWRRPFAANCVHFGLWNLAFALELLLFRRPYFAAINVLAIELVIVLISNSKFRVLREPFVYQDFEYFIDAFRHPRLYLPFLGLAPILLLAGAYALALWAGLALESPDAFTQLGWVVVTACMAALGVSTAQIGGRHLGSVTLKVKDDVVRFGLLATLRGYASLEMEPIEPIRKAAPFVRVRPPREHPAIPPDLVTIQSESFFDIRRACTQIRTDVLTNFDQLCLESMRYGQLHVAAWGANTVRTEFAYLTGLDPDQLGVHRFNPYRKLAEKGTPTIATYLQSLGYRTICVHPYYAEFYRRHKVFPQLGFEEFVDIRAFSDVDRQGPYVGDVALGRYIHSLLKRTANSPPLYIHVITMENHGPLHWERVGPADVASVLTGSMPSGWEDVVAYGRHLRNADQMFGEMREFLLDHQRPAGLCMFGDHVPILPKVYGQVGMIDGATDYLIWSNTGRGPIKQRCVTNAKNIAAMYLQCMGLICPSAGNDLSAQG